jgi:hypothetical protein
MCHTNVAHVAVTLITWQTNAAYRQANVTFIDMNATFRDTNGAPDDPNGVCRHNVAIPRLHDVSQRTA